MTKKTTTTKTKTKRKINYTLLFGIKMYIPVVKAADVQIGNCLTEKSFLS